MKAKKKKKERKTTDEVFLFNNLRDVILEKKKEKIVADELGPESIRNKKKQQVDINLRKSNQSKSIRANKSCKV
jgi:hypothetical protein